METSDPSKIVLLPLVAVPAIAAGVALHLLWPKP